MANCLVARDADRKFSVPRDDLLVRPETFDALASFPVMPKCIHRIHNQAIGLWGRC